MFARASRAWWRSARARAPGNTRCSYTSSVTTIRSCSIARAAISDSSSWVNTLPVGLCGVLSSSRIGVRGVIAGAKLVDVEVVTIVVAGLQQHGMERRAGHRDHGLVAVVDRLEQHHLVAGVEHAEQRTGERLGGTGGDQHLGRRRRSRVRRTGAGASATALRNSGIPIPGGYWLCSRHGSRPSPSRARRRVRRCRGNPVRD